MATTLTLPDVQRRKATAGDEFGAAVVEMFSIESNFSKMIPFETLGTVEVGHERTNSIPTVGFRQGRGAAFGGVSGTATDHVKDAVFSLGAQIDMDKTDVKDKKAKGLMEARTRDAVNGMAWTFNDYFINGDHAVDAYGFEGIKSRFANLASSQTVYANTSSAVLDVRPTSSPSEATMYQWLDRIDEAIYQCDGHTADIALTYADVIKTLRGILRRLNKYVEKAVDSPRYVGSNERRSSSDRVSKPVMVYPSDMGLKWYDSGLKADQSTPIIGTETVNSTACRPIYFIKLGQKYLYGIQQYAIETDGPNKLNDGVTFRTVIDWPVGLHHVHKWFGSKLSGQQVA